MIIISKEASQELRSMKVEGVPVVLALGATPDEQGGYDCTINLVGAPPAGSDVEEIEGVQVAFSDFADSVFAGAVVAINAEGELTLEMAEGNCDSCCQSDGGCCSGSCDEGGSCH